MTSEDARALVEQQLHAGERLLWTGRSDPGRMFVDADRYLIPFGAFFSTAVVWFLVSAVRSHAHPATLVGLSLFVVIGLHVFAGRFLVKRHRKRTQVYAVTTERALVTNGRTTRGTDARRTDWYVDRTARHVSVEWDDTSDLDTLWERGGAAVREHGAGRHARGAGELRDGRCARRGRTARRTPRGQRTVTTTGRHAPPPQVRYARRALATPRRSHRDDRRRS